MVYSTQKGVGEDLHFVHLDNFEMVLREFPHVLVDCND